MCLASYLFHRIVSEDPIVNSPSTHSRTKLKLIELRIFPRRFHSCLVWTRPKAQFPHVIGLSDQSSFLAQSRRRERRKLEKKEEEKIIERKLCPLPLWEARLFTTLRDPRRGQRLSDGFVCIPQRVQRRGTWPSIPFERWLHPTRIVEYTGRRKYRADTMTERGGAKKMEKRGETCRGTTTGPPRWLLHRGPWIKRIGNWNAAWRYLD